MANTETECRKGVFFRWRIENFSYWCKDIHGNHICSPSFTCSGSTGGICSLSLFPKGKFAGDQHLRLQLESSGLLSPVSADCKASFLDENASIIESLTIRQQVLENGNAIVFPPFITHKDVFQNKRSLLLAKDTLTLQFDISNMDGNGEVHIFGHSRIEIRESLFSWPRDSILKCVNDGSTTTIFLLLDVFPEKTISFNWSFIATGNSLASSEINFRADQLRYATALSITFKISFENEQREQVKYHEQKLLDFRNWYLKNFITWQEIMESKDCQLNLTICAATSKISLGIDGVIRNTPSSGQ